MKNTVSFLDKLPDIHEVYHSFGRKAVQARAKNYVIYCRKSLEDHDRKSIPTQLKQCVELARREELNVIGIISEQKSARKYGRPKFTNLLNAINGTEKLECLDPLSGYKQQKGQRPDGIIAWHPDRLSRNMRDAGEIIEMLDEEKLIDLKFAVYAFHNDASGKEHLAMEFARAKGYSDHLQDNVLRGTIAQEMQGKRTKNLPPAFTIIDDEKDPDHLKIIASEYHRYWRDAYRWKLEGKTNGEIAELMMQAGYEPMHQYGGRMRKTAVDKDHVGGHLKNPLHCGWLVPKKSKEPRKADLNELYPDCYNGEEFPVVVTVEDFKRVNPELFSDTAKKPRQHRRQGSYALSGKVYCKIRHDAGVAPFGMTGQTPRGGSKKLSPRFTCQRCKPSHSVNMDDLFEAIAKKIKNLKPTERDHKKFVFAMWEQYQEDLQEEDATRRQLATLKGENEQELKDARATKLNMQFSRKKVSKEDFELIEEEIKSLTVEQKNLQKREAFLNQESLDRYNDLEAFLELTKNASSWWKKANDEQKRRMADTLLLNVEVEGNEVAKVSLKEQFEKWLKRPKDGDGGRWKT